MRLMEAQASFQWSTLSFIAKVYKTIVIHSLFSLKKNFFVGKLSTFILSSHLSISNPLCSILFIKNFSNFSFTEVGFYAKCQWHRRSCSECLRMFATEIQAGKTRQRVTLQRYNTQASSTTPLNRQHQHTTAEQMTTNCGKGGFGQIE